MSKKIHFIAIGGAAMHNLAIALKKKGYTVSGSDDEIFQPSKGRLVKHGLLPDKMGWDPEQIHKNLDAVILGMHARKDNPELLRAQKLDIPIYSFPAFIYEQTKNKQRVVIGGSHGKTTLTSMILHVLNHQKIEFDYLVGAQLKGFDCMVKLSDTSKVAILEGDEYLSSPIDRRPKFHLYKPTIALLTGIAWDHINVFPTLDDYNRQFEIFIDLIDPNGSLVYFEEDPIVKQLVLQKKNKVKAIAYKTPPYEVRNNTTVLQTETDNYRLKIFGRHNLQNLEGAKAICQQLGIDNTSFYKAISSFAGASNRLELLAKNSSRAIFKDFAHSPSKVKATIHAAKEQFPKRQLIACLELHTFSSLNNEFLGTYSATMDLADLAYVYYNPHTVAHKKLLPISKDKIIASFANKNLRVYTDSKTLVNDLLDERKNDQTLLIMSSGNFDGIDIDNFGKSMLN